MTNFNEFLAVVFIFVFLDQIECTSKKNVDENISPGIPIAIIYDKNTSVEIRNLVDKAIRNINNGIKYGRNKWSVQTTIIETNDGQKLMQAVCNQMSRGVLAIFGQTSYSTFETLSALTDNYNIPFISWSYLNKLSYPKLVRKRFVEETEIQEHDSDYYDNPDIIMNNIYTEKIKQKMQLYLRLDITKALIDLIDFYDWNTIYYVYNYNEAITNIEVLFDYQNKNPKFVEKIIMRKIVDIHNCRDMLRAIEASNENYVLLEQKKIVMVIDLDTKESYMHFLNQIRDLGMTKTRFYYVLMTLGIYELDVNDFRHGGTNILGFSIVDYYNINSIKTLSDILQTGEPLNKISNIPHEAALLLDGLVYFTRKINSAIGLNMSNLFGINGVSLRRAEIYVNKSRGINCSYNLNTTRKWPLGQYVMTMMKNQTNDDIYDGLTGRVSFDLNGRRTNYTIGVFKVGLNQPLTKIGYFSSERGLKINEEKVAKAVQKVDEVKKRVVISIQDEPFFMIRPNEPGKNFTGNDRFIGYCVDLTRKIAEIVNFTYELRLVKDNNFGNRDANGNWNGIVGELVRHEADISIAPLTITSQRERAIEFSMPFMNIGISIMIKKPKKEKPGVFSFMAPLDSKIWICVILAFIGVSVILYLVSRFSPYEWHYDASKNENGLNNDFTILNTLWFNLAAVMQQGVDIAPKSVSGRLVASAWWFFTLILISSYTANLAAFLTVERMVSPIESAEQLSRQTEIQYGALEGGATREFFRNSKVDTYQRMWNFMQSWGPSVFVKSNAEGVQKVRDSKGKYAFLLESSLNEYLNERLPCDTIKVGNDLDSKGYGIATPIRSELRDPINLAVLQLREEGFLDELKTRWWYDTSKCGNSASGAKDSSQSALNLINVAGIFYILIAGLILSVFVAGLEMMYKARQQSKRKNIQFTEAIKSKMRISISGYDESINEFRGSRNLIDDKSISS